MVALTIILKTLIVIIAFFKNASGQNLLITGHKMTLKDPIIIYEITFTDTTPQKLNITATSPTPIGNNILFIYELYVVVNKRSIMMLHSRVKEGPCYFLNEYLGKYFNEMERFAGYTPGQCPIPKGTRRVINYESNFGMLRWQNFPRGDTMVKYQLIEKATNKFLLTGVLNVSIT